MSHKTVATAAADQKEVKVRHVPAYIIHPNPEPFPLLPSIACVLESLCSTNDEMIKRKSGKGFSMHEQFTLFHCVRKPDMSILSYLQRLVYYFFVSKIHPSIFTVCMIHLYDSSI